jgi:hypothetical protein
VVVALTYMRRNRVQVELAETYDVSQSTISRAITGITPLLEKALRKYVPTADELDDQKQYVVDGTLLPCWSWAGHPELYSGKHKTTGMNVQLACTLDGELAWISDPIDGARHDTHCLRESGALPAETANNWIGNKGVCRQWYDHPIQKAPLPRPDRLGEKLQHPGQQNPLCHRAGDCKLQDLADHAHRLSTTALDVQYNDLNGGCSALLLDQLNNPP